MFKNKKVRIALFTFSFVAGIALIVGGVFLPALFVPAAAFIGGSLSMFQSAFSQRGSCTSTTESTPVSTDTEDISTDSRETRNDEEMSENRMLYLFDSQVDQADRQRASMAANRPVLV